MSINFLDIVKNYFTSDLSTQAASALGEPGSGVTKALSALIPAGLAGVLSKATAGNDGADGIFDMAKSAIGYTSSSLPDLTNLNGSNDDFVSRIFGGNQSQVSNVVSQFSGIKNSSVSSLSGLVLPTILGLLGKHAQQNNLSASGLSGFLSSQRDNILQGMPAGLSSLGGLLGLGTLGASEPSASPTIKSTAAVRTSDVVDRTPNVIDEPRTGNKWLWPLILILAAIALIWYFSRSCNNSKNTTVMTTDTSTAISGDTATGVTAPMTTTAESIKVELPNGKVLDAYRGGIEDQLVTFLKSDWKSLSNDSLKNRWFDFDNLNFNTGNAVLIPESEKQLDNIAEILKAFPEAKIKIGGYTDASGDASANKKLSKDRADAAKTGLDKRGAGRQVGDTEGYGSEFAKYPATATDQEKAADRHVSVSVRK